MLPGFNPDPSICRRDDEFFLATSSFQWWPGVPIYRSTDLRNWRLCSYGLRDPRYLRMDRIQDSAGVWAPCLSYADGLFWLVFTIANGSRLNIYECDNYLTTAPEPDGPWSEPVYLNSTGNDPSLFHDADGTKWLVNSQFGRTPGFIAQQGTVAQEFSVGQRRLVGAPTFIFAGTGRAAPEGSKLYQHGGWYYVVIAEGGTAYGHQATMARSRNVLGPYEVHPDNPILTATGDPDNPIQRAGHVDLVEVTDEELAVVYLASRPVDGHSFLGRETFLARARWCADGWPRLDSVEPQFTLPDFGIPEDAAPTSTRDDFDTESLALEWNSPRVPPDSAVDLRSRPGWLRLTGSASCIDSLHRPSMLCRRITDRSFAARTRMDFVPAVPDEWAGLLCYYDTRHWYALVRLRDPEGGDGVMLMRKQSPSPRIDRLAFTPLDAGADLVLGVEGDGRRLTFTVAVGDGDPSPVGDPQSALVLSDEFVESENEIDPIPTMGFTGSMVGLVAFDLGGRATAPEFDWFEYQAVPMRPDGDD